MNIRLYLIRHGETEDANPKRYKGTIDVPLSRKGIKQIKRLSGYLAHQGSELNTNKCLNSAEQQGLSAVYCSDLDRAVKSAEVIAQPFGIQPVVVKDLRERHFGQWEGMSFDEIKTKYPKEFQAWAENPLENSPVGGETTREVKDRAVSAIKNILSNHRDDNKKILNSSAPFNRVDIAVVSHGGIIRVLICYFLGIPLGNIFRIEQDFGALNIIEFSGLSPTVKRMNLKV
ncbi:histidine phosphatase family protein [bacterium]|nr:MAG: histidine phosphatase family protein [bacterium]